MTTFERALLIAVAKVVMQMVFWRGQAERRHGFELDALIKEVQKEQEDA